MTHAELARAIARLDNLISAAQYDLAEGMWNPDFCSANTDAYASRLLEGLQYTIDDIHRRITYDRVHEDQHTV